MQYRRPKRYSTRSKVRRTYRKRRYNYRKKNFRGIRRGRIAINARPVTVKATSVPAQLRLTAVVSPTTTASVFWAYIQFQPCKSGAPGVVENLDVINQTGNLALKFPTLSTGDSWDSVYSKTKLKKVVARYYPAVTQGLADNIPGASLSAACTFVTCPIYDNVDDIIDTTGAVTLAPTMAALQEVLRKPYARTHSIYKPVTRVLSPKSFLSTPSYQGAVQQFYKKSLFLDLSNQEVTLNGLLIGVPALHSGGLSPDGANVPFPETGEFYTLGNVNLTYIQSFKVRT